MTKKVSVKLELPSNFQETILIQEVNFNNGEKTLKTIRTLIELYTFAQEYYDSINNNMLYTYYNEKLLKFLTDQEVTRILDEEIIENKTHSLDLHLEDVSSRSKNYSTINLYSDKKNEFHQNVLRELEKVKSNTVNIYNTVDRDLDLQKSSFEERRKSKTEKRNPKKKSYIKRKSSILSEYVFREIDLNSNICNNENEIIKNIIDYTEKKVFNNQLLMQKEIENYMTNNMEEMYKALEQLKTSFEEEIKIMEENGYPDVVKGLREDMVTELETLKEQYEEERSKNIEKIKQKYSKLK